MPPGPAPADPGREQSQPVTPPAPVQAPPPAAGDDVWEPVITRPDPVSEQELEAWLDHMAEQDEPFDPEEYPDPDGPPPPGEDELTAAEIAEVAEVVQAEARGAANGARAGTAGALALIAALGGRRGPGQPGSAGRFAGESGSAAGAFGTGLALDVMPGCPDLDAQCYLVHYRVRNASGGVRAEQAEHTGAAQFKVKISMTWDDMEMDMCEPFGLGEQRHVRLVAACRLAQRLRDRPQQRAEFFGLRGGQLVQCGHVPAGQEH